MPKLEPTDGSTDWSGRRAWESKSHAYRPVGADLCQWHMIFITFTFTQFSIVGEGVYELALRTVLYNDHNKPDTFRFAYYCSFCFVQLHCSVVGAVRVAKVAKNHSHEWLTKTQI